MTDVLIHSPFPRTSGQGNSVTADRLERILLENGLSVTMETEAYHAADARCLIALNARRSAEAVAVFKAKHPDRRIILLLTGTDINHPDAGERCSSCWQSMEAADRLVVLHDASYAVVPSFFQDKCSVIHPSVTLPPGLTHLPDGEGFDIVMAGNFRMEKNPGLAVRASRLLPASQRIHVYGEFSEPGSGRMTIHGIVPHEEILVAMSKARILLNTSTQEGGANAICEAISMGLPVVASAISGNIGMLGQDYAGLFPSGDLQSLVEIVEKSATDRGFYSVLKAQVSARAPLFAYSTETKAWTDLVHTQLS
ncbi:MAG: glycosyltransferase [Akkermansiaceae bacterium]|nr:glycosyltransferase [Akkermansiaceae bacterium]